MSFRRSADVAETRFRRIELGRGLQHSRENFVPRSSRSPDCSHCQPTWCGRGGLRRGQGRRRDRIDELRESESGDGRRQDRRLALAQLAAVHAMTMARMHPH